MRCIRVARTITLFRIRVERELADCQQPTGNIEQALVHQAVFVTENAQLDDLVSHAIFDSFGVRVRDSDE